MITKPAVSNKPSIVLTATGTAVSGGCELISLHYVNTTAGVGQIDVYDGQATVGNKRATLGAAVVGGSDDYCPTQPIPFKNQLNVVFTTGTGFLTIQTN